MNKKVIAGSVVVAVLAGCSSVGPGFANHPGDCALGIPWADCLPGTRGYANGGGSLHKKEAADAAKAQHDAIQAQFDAVRKQCETAFATPELDPIRHKIEFMREQDEAPPFEFASIDAFPSAAERPLIAKWATLRDQCVKRAHAVDVIPPNATPMDITFIKQEQAYTTEAEGRVSELVVALYQQKVTYGEFSQRRYEIGKAASDAQRQYREARLIQDQDRQLQAQQVANQQFSNNLNAWANYMQAVNARQPQTVHLSTSLHCTSTQLGAFTNTNCN
ncbi:hypothetical protein [Burkholderia ubonensis]|uniref:hypothetical protein n=1 Tax=Burkholderia ubonensis TaxID=101571 RepID=UPI00075F32F4|nr:hypothetical protein [Burkholderia ubonensis]KVD70142.1 hypothetical protein WI88_30875 [Burkholderia ubonensis]